MGFSAEDHRFMAQALRLAERGLYTTSPNPRVGCVIVNRSTVVGEGWHVRAGEAHAEAHALQQAAGHACGATAYVTLEPCAHFGRTPPCADALIQAGVARVVIATTDPNPKAEGGIVRLRQAGITVETGLMEIQARELNPGFFSRMESGRSFVRSKIASSLDGGTALDNGVSQWITGEAARTDVQHWRARSCATLTGIGTVLADDPQLNVRSMDTGRQPLRIVLDSTLQLPLDARALQNGPILVAGSTDRGARADALRAAGAEVVALPEASGRIDLHALMRLLAQREINEVHVEAGPRLNGALLQVGLIDELLLYVAPALLGSSARGLFDILPLTAMSQRINLTLQAVDRVGDDLRIRARPASPSC